LQGPANTTEIYLTNAPDSDKYFNKMDEAGLIAVYLIEKGAPALAKTDAKELRLVIAR